MNYFPIKTYPWTTINDCWINTPDIDASLQPHDYTDPIINGDVYDDNEVFIAKHSGFYMKHYDKFALDIVTETVFNYPYPQITEKTLRPLLHKKLFIVMGAPGVLKLLHQKGFKTFNGFIDETYDTILNPTDRFHAIITEIERFCERPLVDVLAYMKTMESALNKNFTILKNLEWDELREL
jgi:hypothetical protein